MNACLSFQALSWLTMIIGAEAFNQTTFGEGTGTIWLDNVQCIGNESHLLNCTANSSGVNSCSHTQDAGVRCLQGLRAIDLE